MPRELSGLTRYSLLLLGFSAIVTQIILIREAMVVFSGNELVIGLTMGLWMLLTALGARLSGPLKSVAALHLLLAVSSFVSVLTLHLVRSLLAAPGALPGFYETMIVLVLAMLPFCLFAGMLFPLLSESFISKKTLKSSSGAYAIESFGSLAGGVLFSLAMVYFLDNWQCIAVVFTFNILISIYFYWNQRKITLVAGLSGSLLAVAAWTITGNPAGMIQQVHYPGQEIIDQQDTPYGRLVVTNLNGQLTIYENGKPHTQSDDVVSREEMVHYAMLVKSGSVRVLMISGGMSGALNEALKYKDASIDYLEADPFLTNMVLKHIGLTTDSRVRIIHQDPRRYIRDCQVKYDVILLNAPDPESGLLNRLFTATFFQELKSCLATDGLLSVAISGGSNYLSNEDVHLHSVIYNSLKHVFNQVGLVPGQRHFFLASDNLPMKMFGEAYRDAGIENSYVNPSYINEMQLGTRSREIIQRLDAEAGLNSDTKPVGYWLVVQRWLSQFGINKLLLPVILAASILVFLIFLKPLALGLFAGGLSASSAEMILLLWLQSVFGYIYQLAGLVFAFFMAGLVIGAWWLPVYFRKVSYPTFYKLQGLMIIFLLVLLLYVFLSDGFLSSGWINLALIFLLTAAAGAITGLQYMAAMRLRKDGPLKGSALSYSADLAGSALGILLISVFCIPLLGIYGTVAALAGFDAIVIGALLLRRAR